MKGLLPVYLIIWHIPICASSPVPAGNFVFVHVLAFSGI